MMVKRLDLLYFSGVSPGLCRMSGLRMAMRSSRMKD
jgi:hypothetical protein